MLLLAKSRANLESRHKSGGITALMSAAAGGHVKCVRVLLDYGADVTAVDDSGRTAKVVWCGVWCVTCDVWCVTCDV